MKKIVCLIACLMLCLCASGAMADTEGDFEYSVSNGEATVTGYTGDAAELVVPETLGGYPVTEIGDRAFDDCSSLVSIDLPDGVTNIGNSAFSWCKSLATIDLPKELIRIGENAFFVCSGLKEVHVSALDAWLNVEFGDEYSSPMLYAEELYVAGEPLMHAVVPEGITSLDKRLRCISLKSVELPSTLLSIGDDEFSKCTSLERVVISEGTVSIGEHAFGNCKKLISVTMPDNMTQIGENAFWHCESLESFVIPNGIELIEDGTFYYCNSLKEITIPDSVTSIGGQAFGICSSLESVDLPEGLTTIENGAFYVCESLISIDIPDGVTRIEDEVFYACHNLMMVDLPEGLTNIGKYAFNGTDVVSIGFPETLTEIGVGAFRSTNLSMIQLPNSVETIGENAFEYCDLRSLTIPSSVTSIPHPIANYCNNLTSIVLPKELTEIADDAFPDSVTKVYCYKGSAADTWAQDTGRFVIYLDSYDIAKDTTLTGPDSNDRNQIEERIFAVGQPVAWKKGYCVQPQGIGQTYTLHCESSDSSVARVDGEMLTFLKNGNVTLTVTVEECPELSHSRKIEVYYPVKSFTAPTSVFMHVDTKPINYKVVPIENITPENANPYFAVRGINWSAGWTDEYNAVRVYAGDTIGVERVRVHSIVGDNEYQVDWDTEPYAQFNLVTYDTVNAIAAAAPSRNLEVGETYQPDITVTVDNLPFVNEPAAYTLKSSKTSVVRPTDDGRLEAVAPGTATITATTFDGSKTAKFNVTVVKATTLRIPAGTKRIEDEAFESVAAATVIIPDGCESIGARAFAGSKNLVRAEIPASVTEIADDAFEGCQAGFVIAAPAGSYAAEYAAAYGYAE